MPYVITNSTTKRTRLGDYSGVDSIIGEKDTTTITRIMNSWVCWHYNLCNSSECRFIRSRDKCLPSQNCFFCSSTCRNHGPRLRHAHPQSLGLPIFRPPPRKKETERGREETNLNSSEPNRWLPYLSNEKLFYFPPSVGQTSRLDPVIQMGTARRASALRYVSL